MRAILAGIVVALSLLASNAFAVSAGDRRFIREGMTEGEVLMKIGKPDSQSEDTGGGATESQKRWIYFPAPGDAQTMTTIVLKNGKVIEVNRQVSR